MKTRILLLALIACCWWATARFSEAKTHPNILVLIADDLGWADVGWHGSEIQTPNLDRLASHGVILDQHYVTPMCSSTRASLLSGRYSTRFGLDSATNELVFPLGMTTLASALRSQGYATLLTGKWHLGSKPEWGPQQFGFDASYGSFAGGVDQYTHLYKKGAFSKTWHRNHVLIEEEGHATDLIASEAIRWVGEAPIRDRPWFIQVAFTAVHVPIQEPSEWTGIYQGEIENPSRLRYAACATHMDHVIGKLMGVLKQTGQFENTLVIFTSDNGGSGPWVPSGKYPGTYEPCPVLGNNEPLRGRKGTVYEGGIRVPAFVHWPAGLEGGRTITAPIHVADWMPTILRLTGYEASEDLRYDGVDVWPVLSGETDAGAERTLYFKRGSNFALRKGNWKLVSSGREKRELFDLAADPNEERDLSELHPDRVNELADLLNEERAGDGKRVVAPAG